MFRWRVLICKEDEDQWFDDEDDMDDHDDFNGEELPKTQRKRELSSDELDSDLADGDFACFDPADKKKRRLQTIQKSYVKMFSKLIKAKDLDESLEKIGVEVPNDPRLTPKELDQNLLDAMPFNPKKFVVRSDNTLKKIEYRLLRATGPSLILWNKLKDARDAKKFKVDISELITLAEASVCTIGQAELELKFQRWLHVATKFLRNPKKAKKVITLKNDIIKGEKSQLFGNVFTKKLVGNLKDTAKLRTALREATSRPRFDGGYNSRGRASGGYNQRRRGGGSQQQPFHGGPRGGRRGGGGRGRGRGGAQTSNRYVQTVYSKVKRSFSECKSKKSSKKRSGFRNKFINSCVFHYRSESSDTVTQPGPDPCSGGKQERGQTVNLHPELADCNPRSVDSGSSRGKTNLVVRNTLSNRHFKPQTWTRQSWFWNHRKDKNGKEIARISTVWLEWKFRCCDMFRDIFGGNSDKKNRKHEFTVVDIFPSSTQTSHDFNHCQMAQNHDGNGWNRHKHLQSTFNQSCKHFKG